MNDLTGFILSLPKEKISKSIRIAAEGSYSMLVEAKRISTMAIITYAETYTPIVHDPTGSTVGLVAEWPNGKVTACKVSNDLSMCYLIGHYDEAYLELAGVTGPVGTYEVALREVQRYYFAWKNNSSREKLYGRQLIVLARGSMNSALVEFTDNGQREVISRNSLRKVKS